VNKGFHSLLLLSLAVCVVGTFLGLRNPPEPAYQGKSLSFWLEEIESKKPYGPAETAVRAIGGKAVPTLTDMLRSHDSSLRRKLMKLAEKQSFIDFHLTPDYVRQRRAVRGFYVLGPAANPGIPALIDLFQDEDAERYLRQILKSIGSDAVLPLARAMTNQSNRIRARVACQLGILNASADAVPALLRGLKDPDVEVRFFSAQSLGLMQEEPTLTLPELGASLRDVNSSVRESAAVALGRFGAKARTIVPILLAMVNEGDTRVANAARVALDKIDPDWALRDATSDAQ
jgi:hypothetical protein